MQPAELSDVLKGLGVTTSEFAGLVRVSPRAAQMWLSGEREIPGPVGAFLRLFLAIPEAMRAAEIARLRKEDTKMFDGLYQIRYAGATGAGTGMLVFDRGAIYGSDEFGGAYDGSYSPDRAAGALDVSVRMTVPAGLPLVQGVPAQPVPYSFDLACKIPAFGGSDVEVPTPFGSVTVHFKRLRDLPHGARTAMFRIQLYEAPRGSGQTLRLVNDNIGEMVERADAVRYVEAYAARHDHSGYNKEQDSWWCRNDGDEAVKTLVIRPS